MQTLFSGGPIDTAHQDDVVQLIPCHRIINLPNFIRPAQAMMKGARGTYTHVAAQGHKNTRTALEGFEACPKTITFLSHP